MSITRHFITVGTGTAASRLLGFVRDVVIAGVLGSGPVADAFFVAFRLPNLFRRIFSEGAFNSAFIPLYARMRVESGDQTALGFSARVLSIMTCAVLALSLFLIVIMPLVVLVLAPGFQNDAHKFELAVLMTRIAFPYLLFMMLMAFFSALLNAHGRFTAAAFAPVLLNVVLIAAVAPFALTGHTGTEAVGLVLAGAVVVAGIAQAGLCWFAARRAELTLPLVKPGIDQDIRQLWALGVPGVIAGGIGQINIVIGTTIASLEPSAVSWLYYADRLYQLPLGIVGVAMGVVLLPDMVAKIGGGQFEALSRTQNRALEAALALTLPASVGLFVLAHPIISVLFERGAFTGLDTARTADALQIFGLGLPAFVLVKVFSSIFFARENTAAPMRFAIWSVIANVVISLGLYTHFGHVGIAAGTTVSGWLNAFFLWRALRRDALFDIDASCKRTLPLILISVLAMTLVLVAGRGLMPTSRSVLVLGLQIGVAILTYVLATWATGAVDWKALIQRSKPKAT